MNKQVDVWEKFLPIDVKEAMYFVWSQWRKQYLPLAILILLCLNVVIAPAFMLLLTASLNVLILG
ncbi:hypothetical protein [Nostoc sp. FACHB-888]|uniref:hypothetical protein n=1 Tax=Nostoc sp. FACHB-888 TaxID=2692842 RepID=UPI0016874EA4|nr:hypothetical protein [Nostoc sp. FACHB-888]MBD2244354.1 hypothetical protein [Nostoc sp. FACHB-888]MCC5648736.1 hypothetical protein [Nostoc sp. XA013]